MLYPLILGQCVMWHLTNKPRLTADWQELRTRSFTCSQCAPPHHLSQRRSQRTDENCPNRTRVKPRKLNELRWPEGVAGGVRILNHARIFAEHRIGCSRACGRKDAVAEWRFDAEGHGHC